MEEKVWQEEILPQKSFGILNVKEILRYKDLIMLFVKRDFVTLYKQTILGPFWYLIQPLMQTLIYTMMFGNLFSISDETGVPSILFYLSGNVTWLYFSQCLVKTSNTFAANAGIFGKVYFPRIIVPISTLISNLIGYGIQFLMFILFFGYYYIKGHIEIDIDPVRLLLIPVLIVNMALLGLGIGLFITSATTKYRDFKQFIGFGVQLLMFMSPVLVPMSIVLKRFPAWSIYILKYNPMTPILEGFRAVFFSSYDYNLEGIYYSLSFGLIIFIIGGIFFNRSEQNFMDTV